MSADLGMKVLEDVEALLHPGLLLVERTGEGVGGETVVAMKRAQEVQLFLERRAAFRVVEFQALDEDFNIGPLLDEHPGLVLAALLECEKALEAIDDEEVISGVHNNEGKTAVDIGGRASAVIRADDQLGERYPAQIHGLMPLVDLVEEGTAPGSAGTDER